MIGKLKTYELSDKEYELLQVVDFSYEGSEPTAVITQQLERDDYKIVAHILEVMHGHWSTKRKVFTFKTGYNPKDMMRNGRTLTIERDGFFETPVNIIDEMIRLANFKPDDDFIFLEPSAGMGAIVKRLIAFGARHIMAVETNPDRCKYLESLGDSVDVVHGDFMTLPKIHKFDRILMNPPFENLQCRKHIEKAAKHHLKPGGILVAISDPAQPKTDYVDTKRELPKNTFKDTPYPATLITFENIPDEQKAIRQQDSSEYEPEVEIVYEDPAVIAKQIIDDLNDAMAIMKKLTAELNGDLDCVVNYSDGEQLKLDMENLM